MKKSNEGNEIEVLDLGLDEEKKEEKKSKEVKTEYDYEPKENLFTRLMDNFKNLSSRQKTIIIVASVLVLLLIVSVILYVSLSNNKDTTRDVKKKVIVAKDNYRYEDGTLYFIVNNKEIGSYSCKNKDKDLCYVAFENNDDEFDETRYITKDDKKARSKIYQNRYVVVFDSGKKNEDNLILYDIKKQKSLGNYKNIKTYQLENENQVFLQDENLKYGLVEFTENKMQTPINFEYDYLGIITEDKEVNEKVIVAQKDEGYFLMDFEGKPITQTLNGAIKNYNNKYVKTMDATKKYALYDYEGKKIVDSLNYIDLLDDYYIAVDDKNTLKIFGYDETKYLEDGLELHNIDYVKTIDQTKDTEEIKYAYTYELDDKKLKININNDGVTETKEINLFEGLASKKLKYISYYNGSLYFYGDEKKEELINSYKCNNVNTIKNENSKLENCRLASDTVDEDNDTNESRNGASIVPIFNKRFVFIQDGKQINLVDLKDEKVIGAYQTIDSFSDASKTDPYLLETTSQYIIAKNKSNKYGMLKLTESDIKPLYSFDYDKLEKLKGNILAINGNKSYLLDYNGNKTTKEYNGRIRNYYGQYVKVLNKDKYYVYNDKGTLMFEDGFKYVELYDNYVALVNSKNHLTVKNYKGEKIINDVLKLSSTTYYGAKDGYVNAFSIRKKDNLLTITAATSQNTKKEKAKDFVFDLTTKKRVNG